MLTFYDVVIDFIFFDAFEDLDNPPAALSSVMQNRWLTTGFKEMASHSCTPSDCCILEFCQYNARNCVPVRILTNDNYKETS